MLSGKLSFQKPLCAWVRRLESGETVKLIELNQRPFGVPLRPDLIQRVAVWYRAGIRAGTASTKDRSQVMGSTRKLRPNNNLGKARVGDIRSPIRRGGGICHGPKPKDWAFPLPAPVFHQAFMSALAAKFKQNELLIIDADSLNLPNRNLLSASGDEAPEDTEGIATEETNELQQKRLLECFSKSPHLFANHSKLLFIDTHPFPESFRRATYALPTVFHATVQDDLNAYHLLNNDLLILTERCCEYYEQLYAAPRVFKPVHATTPDIAPLTLVSHLKTF